jgi:hypothetical protein
MGAPQIIMIVLYALGLAVTAEKHGEPRSNHNLGSQAVATAISAGLLYWGGFFS